MNDLFYHLADIPLLGPAFGIAVSLPGHYMNIMAISEAVLISILVFNVWSDRHKVFGFIKRGGYIFVVAMALTFIAASWYTLYGAPLLATFSIYDIFAAIIGITVIAHIVNLLRKKTKVFPGLINRNRSRRGAKAFKIAVTVIVVFIVLFQNCPCMSQYTLCSPSSGMLISQRSNCLI